MQRRLQLRAADPGSIQELKALNRIEAKAHKCLIQEALPAENLQLNARFRAALAQEGNRRLRDHRVAWNSIDDVSTLRRRQRFFN
ncbi:hypothetical protein D3C81_1832620 [compost metagenome]